MSYYDSSTLTKRRQNKVIASDFINRINYQNTTSYGPTLGISNSSIINNVSNGQMKYIRKCDGTFGIDNGCPCETGISASQSSGPAPLVNWPAFIVGDDATTNMLSVSYSVSDDNQRVYITGLFSGTVNLFNGGVTDTTSEPWVIQLVTATTLYDGFIACYSSSGQVLWATAIETRSPGTITQGFSITDDVTGVYVTGIFGDYVTPTPTPIVTSSIDFYNGITSGIFDGTGPADATLATTNLTPSTNLAQFIVKYDTSGVVQWVTKIDNYFLLIQPVEPKGYQCSITTNGAYVFVSGNFFNNTTLYNGGTSAVGSSAYVFNLSNSIFNTHLACYDTSGTFVWATYMESTGGASFGTGLTCDATHVYITGFMGQIQYYDTTIGKTSPTPLSSLGTLTALNTGAFIISYTTDGVSLNWVAQVSKTSVNGGFTFGQSMSVDATGLYVAVLFAESADVYEAGIVNPVSITNSVSNATYNYAIIKYTLSGSIAWIQQINDIGDSNTPLYEFFGSSISSDGNGVYVTSSYRISPITLFTTATATGPGPTTTILSPIVANQFTDAYLVKYDTSGTLQWMTAIGGTDAQNGYGVVSNGTSLYVTGLGSSVTNFYNANGTNQPSVIGATLNPSPSPAQFTYLVKYNSNGQLVN